MKIKATYNKKARTVTATVKLTKDEAKILAGSDFDGPANFIESELAAFVREFAADYNLDENGNPEETD